MKLKFHLKFHELLVTFSAEKTVFKGSGSEVKILLDKCILLIITMFLMDQVNEMHNLGRGAHKGLLHQIISKYLCFPFIHTCKKKLSPWPPYF